MENTLSRYDAPIRPGQPMPLRTKYNHHGPATTAILRTWASRAATAACRLCPRERCSVDAHLQCLIVVARHVPGEDCPLYRDGPSAPGVGGAPRLNILAV